MTRRTGDVERGRKLLESFAGANAWSRPRAQAELEVVCGDFDSAIESLKAAADHGDPGVWLLFAGTSGNRLRSTRGWPALRARLKLPAS